jgi:predicted nucleic acid-binding protein
VLPDTTFWIALTLENHPGHALATAWQETSPLGRISMIFCRHIELSFLWLTTRESTMLAFGRKPFSNSDATQFLASVQANPLVTELAAFAIRHGLDLLTFDKGFRKFAEAGLLLRLF